LIDKSPRLVMDTPVVLVTGAGRGLGRAIAREFHNANFRVVAADRDPALLADLETLPRYLPAEADVTDGRSVRELADRIAGECGRLDVVVNNAGIIGYFPVVEMDPERVIAHFHVNSFGALRVVHACIDLLVASRGRVVNITSEAFRFRNPFQIYAVTKLTLEGLSDVMRRELGLLGIHVATVRPGAIDTDLFRSMQQIHNPVPDGRLAGSFEKFARQLARRPPSRVSAPGEVARLVYCAATDPRPRPHYEINNMLVLKLAAALPTALVDRAAGRMLR
jgi:NAD(P)-dependent dehydrogenase (short-subunit alcohol dehydrogenase family)